MNENVISVLNKIQDLLCGFFKTVHVESENIAAFLRICEAAGIVVNGGAITAMGQYFYI